MTDSCSLIRDSKEAAHGTVIVFRDVSEAQRARTFFRALVERSTDGIALTAPDGTFTYASPAAAHLLGRTPEAIVGTNVIDYAYPEDVAAAREYNRGLAECAGTSVAAERRIKRPDGSSCWVEVTGTNRIDDPAVGAIIRNMRDVTERKGSEGALRASEARFARLSESGLVGIALADTIGNVHDANDAYLGILGYSQADLRAGKVGWASMTPPEWAALDDCANDQLKNTGVARPWEKELFRRDGSRAPVLIGIAMLGEHEFITFIVDLSDRKQSERTLRETEEQLRQAQKMEAVGRLAGGVAHDFNNMLSVVLSYSQLLLADVKPSDPMHADLDEIQKAGQRAADLTRQLLMFSRQQVIEPRVVDLNDVLSGMERMLRRLLGEDIDIALTKRSTARVLVDPSGIEQVVMNLVVNARDAMPTGGKLTIETADVVLDEEYARHHVGVSPGPHVMLAVTDGGMGMDAATRERIFEPFFTTKEKGKGTGLGLTTVFGIATQSGGSVWVYSELGLGTTFKLYFPRTTVGTPRTMSGSLMPAVLPTTLRGTETILLVEDEEQVRAVAHASSRGTDTR